MKRKEIYFLTGTAALCLLLILGVSYAWFFNHQTNRVDGVNVTVDAGNMLQVSLDGVNFTNQIELAYPDSALPDITGDGVAFWNPVRTQQDITAVPNPNERWEVAEAGTDYITMTIRFRASNPCAVYLGSDTALTPNAGTTEADLIGSTLRSKSNYGDFSKDCIAGASRVSFVGVNTGAPILVWVPNSTYELIETSEGGGYTYEMTLDGIPETSYGYYTQAGSASAVIGTFPNDKIRTEFTTVLDAETPVSADELLTLTKDDTGFYTGSVTVNIWVEGCDRESRRALSGGVFNTTLQFIAFGTEGGGGA